MISIIIVNYNTKEITYNCIKSIYENKTLLKYDYEIIVVDNLSTDGSVEYLQNKLKNSIKIIRNSQNLGFGVANNIGIKNAIGETIILLNSDTIVKETNFDNLINILDKNSNIGILSSKVLNEDGSIQSLGYSYPGIWNDTKLNLFWWNYNFVKKHRLKNYKDKGLLKKDWVCGCFMIFKKYDFDLIGGFDENIFMYSEDIDLCARMEKIGKENYVYDKTYIYHLHGKSGDKTKPKLRKLLDIKKNYYYVINKNRLSNSLGYIKLVNTINLIILSTLKNIIFYIKKI